MSDSQATSLRPNNETLLSRGYGYIPKSVMQNRTLSATAKAIYAYLCSYCGRGGEAWPSVRQMMDDLGLGKEGLARHMKALVSAGFVSVRKEKRAGRFASNVYVLAGWERREGAGPGADAPEPGEPWAAQADTAEPTAVAPDAAKPSANNNISPKNNGADNTCSPVDDDESSSSQRAPAREAIRRQYHAQWGREALRAEVDALAGLLQLCDAEALVSAMEKAALHRPASPARYVRRLLEQYRADAVSYGLIKGPWEKLTLEAMDRVEAKNDMRTSFT